MIISNNNNHKDYNRKNNFGNAALFTSGMNYLATNEAIGATAVDMGAMVIPRTIIDSTRSPEAGAETLRRELVSCLFFAAMGYFGLGAANAIMPFTAAKEYNVPLPKITAGSDAVDSLAHSWNKALDKHGRELTDSNRAHVVNDYLNEVIGSVSGLSGDNKVSINSNPEIKNDIVKEMQGLILDNKEYIIPKGKKEQRHKLVQKIIHSAGSSENLTLAVPDKKAISIGAEDLLNNTYSMARTFMSDKVATQFKTAEKIEDNKFLKDLKGFNTKKMGIGLAAATAFALSMQAINRWVTKKKTGSGGFVAVKGQKAEKDKSTGFMMMKLAASAAMVAFSAKFIRDKGSFRDIPKKLEFTKLMPNMAQYKFIYGATIIGRFMASTDKNELRESVTRDFLGFTSWLILGDVAARTMAKGFERIPGVSLLNHKEGKPSGLKQTLMDSAMKTHEEILYAKGESTLGKNFKDAFGVASANAKKSLKYRNIAQLGGYVVSGLLLGIGIPLLNKTITNKVLAGKKPVQAQPQAQPEAKSEPNKKLPPK